MRNLSYYFDKISLPLYRKFGFHHFRIIEEWPLIVGERLTEHAFPYKITKYNNIFSLHIIVTNSGIATEIHYHENIILEKIAIYIGYAAIAKIKIIQSPINLKIDANTLPTLQVSAEDLQILKSKIDLIENDGLFDSLMKLGILIHNSSI